jgi:hypothetical protein
MTGRKDRVRREDKVFLARYTADVDVIVTLKFDTEMTYEDAWRHARAGAFNEDAVQNAIDEGRARVIIKGGSVRIVSVTGNGQGG